MDFFAHQDAARRASTRLMWAMIVAIIAVVVAVDLAVVVCFGVMDGGSGLEQTEQAELVAQTMLWASLGTVAVILGGAGLAWLGLRGGGRQVAESLGGREIVHGTADPDEKRLLNVVEEMAIASGVPCPPVFALADDGINAFAAGHTTADAAIGVTRGAVRQLSRDELQGVIAHEFSHVLNGDMRLNMRLIAAVAGLIAIAAIGRVVLRVAFRSGGSGRKKGNPLPFIAFGLALVVIGGLGWLAGRLIQSAFSRRREFLADASAVQFTRNPGGIASALRRIGAGDSRVDSPKGATHAHLFFANALSSGIAGWFATHPPLPERIARLDGLPAGGGEAASGGANPGSNAVMGFAGAPAQPALRPASVLSLSGAVSPERVRFSAAFLQRLPAALAQAAREPVSARAVSLLPLLHHDPAAADRQIALVHHRDPWLANELRRLQPHWLQVDADAARLPLLQLAAAALGAMSPRQRQAHLSLCEAMAREDGILTLREFCVLRRLQLTLAPRTGAAGRLRLRDCRDEAVVVLGTLALAAGSATGRDQAFTAGWARLPLPGTMPPPPEAAALSPTAIGAALDRLTGLDAAGARALVDAGAHAIAADGTVNAREAELLRLVADALGVPLPPFAGG